MIRNSMVTFELPVFDFPSVVFPFFSVICGVSPAVVDVNPAVVALFAAAAAKYPSNSSTVGDGLNTGGYSFNSPAPVKENTHTARFDLNLTAAHSFSLRANYQQDLATGVSRFPDTPGTSTWSHPLGFSAKHTWLINNNVVNTFTYGFMGNAFSRQGDSSQNAITFGNNYPIFTPFIYARTFNRTTPVQNFTNDLSWVKGNHTFQFGGNVRLIKNKTENFAAAFDNAFTNETFYATSGTRTPQTPVLTAGYTIASSDVNTVKGVLSALWGRYSQYSAFYNYELNRSLQPTGSGVLREYAAEEYDFYAQDIWKFRPNLTITAGVRYGLSMPIYETNGFETKPNIALAEYQRRREAASANGQNYTDPLQIVLSGKANGAPTLYPLDKNNIQPRFALAWSPNVGGGWLGKLLGTEQQSVFRGGFAMTNDYFGQALALGFDGNNVLGFATTRNINFNTFTIYESGCLVASRCNPGPLFTGLNQAIKGLPLVGAPSTLTFPNQQPLDDDRRIQGSLDSELQSPVNYTWNVSYGRKLPMGMYVDASYVGRLGRNLLASRDVMAPNNLRDPVSGQTYFEAAMILEGHRRAQTPISQIPNLPFFENTYTAGQLDGLFFGAGLTNTRAAYAIMSGTPGSTAPDCGAIGGCFGFGIDWTFLQDVLDGSTGRQLFYNRQYGALAAFGTIGNSDYHAGTLTIRQRTKGITWDLNYTFSKSIDDASGLQNAATFGGSSFILNALNQSDFRANSDFDIRHLVNANAVWDVPLGRGRQFFSGMNKFADAILGGWQMVGVFRYNSGLPFSLSGVGGWPTNWNRYSYVVRNTDIETKSTPNGVFNGPNNFADARAAYRSFRSPGPGESGDRNQLRFPSYIVLDMGLEKSFSMPWKEGHKLSIRAEAFNVTNTQRFTGFNNASLSTDPEKGAAPTNWGNYTNIQGSPRIMQFAIRYDF